MNRCLRHPGAVHGTAVSLGGRGVLILGAAGSGKSQLALKLVARGADLVADDRVLLAREAEGVHATAPATIAGLIEARSVGLLRLQAVPSARLDLVIDLDAEPEGRLPQRRKIALLGQELELIRGRSVPDLDVIVTLLLQRGAVLC